MPNNQINWFKKVWAVMAVLMFILVVAAAVIALSEVIRIRQKIAETKKMINVTVPYERIIPNSEAKILIIGDSLGYGIGASQPEKSVAGLLSQRFPNASIINKSRIGATVASLSKNIEQDVDGTYDSVFLFIGGNDVARTGTDMLSVRADLQKVYDFISPRASKVFVYPNLDFDRLGITSMWSKSYLTNRSDIFYKDIESLKGNYPNIIFTDTYYADPELVRKGLAADGYHLNDLGYKMLVDQTFSE
jgi:lysophospholipase L1-like esterase